MEAAALALGILPVLPVLLRAVTSFQAFDKVQNRSRASKRLYLQIQAQKSAFVSECRALLRFVTDCNEFDLMLKDKNHSGWEDINLESRFRHFLGNDLDLFAGIMEEIATSISELESKLSPDRPTSIDPSSAGVPKAASDRNPFRHKLSIVFNEKQYHDRIDLLRKFVADLSTLRSRLVPQPFYAIRRADRVPKDLPYSIRAIHQASRHLDHLLREGWSCKNKFHKGHCARLCLDAAVKEFVSFDLYVSVDGLPNNSTMGQSGPELPLWLYIRHTIPHKDGSVLPVTQKASYADLKNSRITSLIRDSYTNSAVKNTIAGPCKTSERSLNESQEHEAAAMATEMCDDSAFPSKRGPLPGPTLSANPFNTQADLKLVQSICCHLQATFSRRHQNLREELEEVKGFLSTDTSQFTFHRAGQSSSYTSTSPLSLEGVPLKSKLQSLSILQQLKFAHKISIGVLQYHSTAWLSQYRLDDISLSSEADARVNPNCGQDQVLRLGARFSGSSSEECHFDPLCGSGFPSLASLQEDVDFIDGIRNSTLFDLGLNLLEIGYRKPVASLRHPSESSDQVAARRLASGFQTGLGPIYQEVVRKCLDSDFAPGSDLRKDEVQYAVYTDVVWPLENLYQEVSRAMSF